jgi:tRNA dimethylallyltransferase
MIATTLIALEGQTSSGKSEMAIQLAKELQNCWIINCDSRQIYKYLNLGSGKITGKWEMLINDNQLLHTFLYQQVPHFFIDIVDPSKQYSLAHFLADFRDFCKQYTLPKYLILCGGTGLYIKAILEKYSLPELNPKYIENYDLEKAKIEKLLLPELQQLYIECNFKDTLNNSDYNNSRRLMNKILANKCESNKWCNPITIPDFKSTYSFAISCNQEDLYKKIKQRILDRINQGMINEVESLEFLGTDRLLALGLEYRLTHLYLLGQLTYQSYVDKLVLDSVNYAQKQLTWLKKQPVQWITSTDDILKKIS